MKADGLPADTDGIGTLRLLGWNPTATSFKELVKLMVKSDIKLAKKEETIRQQFD